MIKNKVKIIDNTLIALYERYKLEILKHKKEVKELIELINKMGCDYIEITKDLYEKLKPFSNEINLKFKDYIKVESYENIGNKEKIRLEISDKIVVSNYADYLLKIIQNNNDMVELSVKNECGCSTGISLEYIKLGGQSVVTSFNGIGGYSSLEEVICYLSFIERKEDKAYSILPRLVKIYEKITGEKVKENKPLIGENIFDVESGIHVNGISKDSNSFEPYSPHKIGRSRKIILGKHSGKKTIELKLSELNIPYEEKKLDNILDLVRRESDNKKRGLYDEEVSVICERVGS